MTNFYSKRAYRYNIKCLCEQKYADGERCHWRLRSIKPSNKMLRGSKLGLFKVAIETRMSVST